MSSSESLKPPIKAEVDKVNILLVDDQPAKLLTHEAILSDLGENLIKVTSGKKALDELLKHDDFAVIVLDVSMPEIDGLELADMIRQHPRFQQTAIIFVSAIHQTDLDRAKGYARGAVDYVSVPFDPELLRAKVRVFADLYRKTKQLENLNAELQRLSSMLLSAQDQERRRIARELHDGLGQELTAAKMTLSNVLRQENLTECKKQAATLETMIDSSIQQVRNVSYLLHPPLLDEMGLASALNCYVEGLSSRGSINLGLDVQPSDFPRLKQELESAVFRIIQEALTNVFRHSEASRAWVQLVKNGRNLSVTVGDNGKGVAEEITKLHSNGIGVGISGMRQRVQEFGGELRVLNAQPGTIIEATFQVELDSREA